jgi:hypothetical protein
MITPRGELIYVALTLIFFAAASWLIGCVAIAYPAAHEGNPLLTSAKG